MRIGQLDRKAEIIGLIAGARDEYNESTRTPQVIAEVWCRVVQTPGREFMAASQLFAEERAVITIRYRAGITAENEIHVDGKTWQIHSIRELGRRRYLEIAVTYTSGD